MSNTVDNAPPTNDIAELGNITIEISHYHYEGVSYESGWDTRPVLHNKIPEKLLKGNSVSHSVG